MLFALAAILLFHTHPFGIVPVGVLGILTLIYRPFVPQRRWFWLAIPAILIFTLPWLALARRGYAEGSERVHSIGQFRSVHAIHDRVHIGHTAHRSYHPASDLSGALQAPIAKNS